MAYISCLLEYKILIQKKTIFSANIKFGFYIYCLWKELSCNQQLYNIIIYTAYIYTKCLAMIPI